MAVSLETIRTLTTRARTEGVDAARRELESYASAQMKISSSANVMRSSNDNASRSVLSAATAFDKLERSIDPVARANTRFEAEQRKVTRAINEGAVSAERAQRAMSLIGARRDDALAKAGSGAAAAEFEAATKSAGRFNLALEGVRSFTWNNSSFSGNDIDRVINPIQGLGRALGSIPTIAIASAAAAEVALTAIGATAQRTLAELQDVSRQSGLGVNQIAGAQIVGARSGLTQEQTRGALTNAGNEFAQYQRNAGGVKDALEQVDEGFLKVADKARSAGEFIDLVEQKIRALPNAEGLDLSQKLFGEDAGAKLFANIQNGALSMRSLGDEAARAGTINEELARHATEVQHQIDEAAEVARTKLLVAFQDLGNPVDNLKLGWWGVVGSIGDAVSKSEELKQLLQGLMHPIDTMMNAPKVIGKLFEQQQPQPIGRLIDMNASSDFDQRKADFFARGPKLASVTAGETRARYAAREDEGASGSKRASGISDEQRAAEAYTKVTHELENQKALLTSTGEEHDKIALKIDIERHQLELGTGATEQMKTRVAEMVTELDKAKKAQDALNESTKSFNTAYSAAANTVSGAIKDIVHGGKPADALQKVLTSAQDNLLDAALTGGGPYAKLLGLGGGKNGEVGGLFGGIASALGLGGNQTTAQMNVQAANVVVNGGIGGAGAGGGGGLLGAIGSLFNSGSSGTNEAQVATGFYADGGPTGWSKRVEMLPAAAFHSAPHFSDGGKVGRPAILHDGEIVLNAMHQANIARQIMPSAQSLAYARSLAGAGNDNAQGSNGGAPVGKSEVHFHGAPEGTQMKESVDRNGNRRTDITFKEMVAGAIKSPTGVSALRSAGRMTKY